MDGEKRQVANGGVSADGDTFDGINPLEKPTQLQFFDVDDDEELATPKETDGSEDTIKALDGEIHGLRLDRSELQRRMEELTTEMERSDAGARSLAARAAELEGKLSRCQEDLNLTFSEADSLRLTVKTLEDDKAILEVRVRDLETRMSDLESEKLKAVSDALCKDEIIKSMQEDLNVETEKAIVAAKKKDEEVVKTGEFENWKKEAEMERVKYCALVREKDEEIVSLKEELVVATLNVEEIKSLKEELMTARKKAMDEVAALKENTRVVVAQYEEVIISLKEALIRNGREQLESEKKKAAAALAEKEREVVSLKQELLLEREKKMEELEAEKREVVADKEAEISLVNERLSQAMVVAREMKLREEDLEREMKQFKNRNSELEGKIKGLQFKVGSDVAVQSSRGIDLTEGKTEGDCPKVSWIAAAAVAASSGTIAAVVTAFCLHRSRQS